MPLGWLFTSGRRAALPKRRRAIRNTAWRGRGCHVDALEERLCLSISIQFDYTFDTNNFFNTQQKRDLLTQAAAALQSRLLDDLSAIQPFGGDTWSATFTNPLTGILQTVFNTFVPADTLVVYVGGRDLPGSTLAEGGPGGWSGTGSTSWLNLLATRGEAGASGANKTDFGPWGGSITFDTVGTNWFFGATTTGLTTGKSDFVTVASHELGHVLGFGSADSFKALISAGKFLGTRSVAAYDPGGTVQLDPGKSHWAEATKDAGLETILDPTISSGVRKAFTPLDFAGLGDIGWTLAPNVAPVLNSTGSPQLTSITEDSVASAGTLITTILASGANGQPINDPDPLAPAGIAITGVDNSNGTWEFSTDGSTWISLGSPSNGSARLLAGDSTTKLRFLPAQDFSGTVTNGITFRAWDQMLGANGGTADTTTNGGSTPYSSAIETASIFVDPVVDAPSVTNAATNEDTQTSSGLVILRNAADGNEVTHFRITAIAGGTLFLNDGTTAINSGEFITVAQGAVGLRFMPTSNSIASGSFSVQSSTSDSIAGLAGSTATATISVNPVNDAPSFTVGDDVQAVAGAGPQTLLGWATDISRGAADEFAQTLTFLVDAGDPDLFSVLPEISATGTLTFTTAPGASGSTTVTVILQDNGSTNNGGEDTSPQQTFEITIVPATWQNPLEPLDVDGDETIGALDALRIINEINTSGPHTLTTPTVANGPPPYFDVNGDGVVSALDALAVINYINSQPQFTAHLPATSQATSIAEPPLQSPSSPAAQLGPAEANLAGAFSEAVWGALAAGTARDLRSDLALDFVDDQASLLADAVSAELADDALVLDVSTHSGQQLGFSQRQLVAKVRHAATIQTSGADFAEDLRADLSGPDATLRML